MTKRMIATVVAAMALVPMTVFAQDRRVPQPDAVVSIWSPSHHRFGASVLAITRELRAHFGANSNLGVLVSRVTPGGLASQAGVRVGDVIIRVDGRAVGSVDDLRALVYGTRAGQRITIDVMRNKVFRRLAVTIPKPQEGGVSENSRFRFRWPTDLLDPWRSEPVPADSWGPGLNDGLDQRVLDLERRLRELERRLKDVPDRA